MWPMVPTLTCGLERSNFSFAMSCPALALRLFPSIVKSCPPPPAADAAPAKAGADDQDRTGDLVLTKDVLCQLSYIGLRASCRRRQIRPRQTPVQEGIEVPDRSSERRLERETGIEPATNSLEGCDSTTELLPPTPCSFPAPRATVRTRLPPHPSRTLFVQTLPATIQP